MVDDRHLTRAQRLSLALDRNLSVIAGAGTGKTQVLARRFLRILEANRERAWTNGDVACPPGYLVAVTFTRKAAEEMRGRIAKRIGERIRSAREADDAETFAYWTKMRRALDDATITTLDGLAHKIVLDHALLVGVDPESTVLDTVDTRILIDETVDEVLADPPEGARDDLQHLLVTSSPYSVRQVLAALLSDRGFAHRWATETLARDDEELLGKLERWAAPCTPEEARAALDKIAHALQRVTGRGPQTGKATEFLDLCHGATAARSEDDDACLRAIANLIPRITKQDGALYKRVSDLVGTQPDWKPTGDPKLGQQLYDEVAGAVASYVDDCLGTVGPEDRTLLVLMRALARTYLDAEIRYSQKKRRRSALDYADLQHEALKILRMPGVAADVRARIRHLLVDEFQDTNETQWELVRLLAADPWETDHAPWEDESEEDPEAAFVSAAELFGDPSDDEPEEAPPATSHDIPTIDATITGDLELSEPHGDPSTPLGNDRLFMVGDAKQSIYGFRGADVSVYHASRQALKAANRDHGIDRSPLSGLLIDEDEARPQHEDEPEGEIRLDKNFRSLPNLVAFTNALFDELLRPMETTTHAPYEAAPGALEAHRGPLEGNEPGQIHLLVTPADPAGYETTDHPERDALAALDPHEAAATRIAQHIADHLDGPDAFRIEDEEVPLDDPRRFRAATPSDIAILLPRRTHLKTLERALAREGIRYVIAGGRGYWQRQEVWDQVNLLAFLVDPYRDVALAGLLRSPYFAWTDDAVVRLALDDSSGPLWKRLERAANGEGGWSPPRDFQGVPPNEVYQVLTDARAAAGAIPTHRVLQRVQEQTAYLAALSSEEQPDQALANVEKFLTQVREREARSGVHLPRLLRDIEHLIDSDTDEAEAELPEDAEGVRIMTIHAAKGLEFPVVYLPDLARGFRSGGVGEAAGFRRGILEDIPLISTKTLHHETGEPTEPILHRLLGREEKKKDLAEAARLFYVAVTRARDHLVLHGPSPRLFPKKDSVDVPPRHEAKSCLDWVEAALGIGPDLYAEVFAEDGQQTTRRLGSATYRIDLTPPRTQVRHSIEADATVPTADATLTLPEVPRSLPPLLVHPSAVEIFRACPARFRYRHLDGLPDLRVRGLGFQHASRGPLLGALVHRVLETTRDDEPIPPRTIARVRSVAAEHGHDPDAMERDVAEHVRKARAGLAMGPAPIKELVFEHAWADGIRTRGAIDRLVHDDGHWMILDTKSDRPSGDVTDHGAAAGYDAQVTLYAEAVRALAGTDTEAALVYTSTGERVPVPPDATIPALRERLEATRALDASPGREEGLAALWPRTPEPRDLCEGCGFYRRYGGPCAGAAVSDDQVARL